MRLINIIHSRFKIQDSRGFLHKMNTVLLSQKNKLQVNNDTKTIIIKTEEQTMNLAEVRVYKSYERRIPIKAFEKANLGEPTKIGLIFSLYEKIRRKTP